MLIHEANSGTLCRLCFIAIYLFVSVTIRRLCCEHDYDATWFELNDPLDFAIGMPIMGDGGIEAGDAHSSN